MKTRFIVFADSHIGTYAGSSFDEDSGLDSRLVDGLKVWDEIEKYAELNSIKTIIFLGDRFRSSNPQGYIRDLADEKLRNFSKKFKFLCLVGNHDYYTKSSFYHSYGVGHIFKEELSGLVLFDDPSTVCIDDVCFWALPYARTFSELNLLDWRYDCCNVLLFHNEAVGAKFPSGMTCEKGLKPEEFKKFDLVLGGHIHLSQRIAGSIGGFVGSVTQLRRDDANQRRGWWDIIIEDKKVEIKEVESSAPKYILGEIDLLKGDEWQKYYKDKNWINKMKGNYFILKGVGSKKVFSTIDRRKLEQELVSKCELRSCVFEPDIQKNYEFKFPELRNVRTHEEEIDIALNRLDRTGLEIHDLKRVGLKIKEEMNLKGLI